MPRYRYDGRDAAGKFIRGIIDAGSEGAVAAQLIRMGISPITIASTEEPSEAVESLSTYFRLGYPTLQDLSFLSRQMYSLTRAGVPIVRALRVIIESSKNEILRLALGDVVLSVEEGQALGVALKRHPRVFPTIMISLINVGENSGRLDEVFLQMATHFERELDTRKRVKMAMRYPMMVVAVLLIALIIVNVVVIPAFSSFFKQFKADLPLPTLILIATSEFIMNYWMILLAGIFLSIVLWVAFLRTPKGRFWWDKTKLSIPIAGDVLKRTLLARFARSFALCLKSGVPLLESVALISRATDNVYVGEQILAMRSAIEHGGSLTSAATESRMFTALVLQMFAIGEETGEIDRLLEEVANYYDQEVDYDVKQMGDIIEPVILVILGAMVLVLALGIYLPMWNLSRAALGKN